MMIANLAADCTGLGDISWTTAVVYTVGVAAVAAVLIAWAKYS